MEAFLLLCDAANTDQGSSKVNMLGAGWSITGPNVPASAISGFLRAAWDEVENPIRFSLHLVDEEGNAVCPFGEGDGPIRLSGSFSLPGEAHMDDMAKRVPLNIAFAVPLPPLPLQTARAYRWILEMRDEQVAVVDFAVRSAPE
ncbi:hypothetical protein GCM10017673_52460 [Streptosporangium violaceochromogenes]|nr:hypothetical protein GCM10017673_52460 [Streptosporangium violaceochromogenes]